MSGNAFSLADLIPEPLIFTDTDGTRYEVLRADELSPIAIARQGRIKSRFDQLMQLMQQGQIESEEQAAAALEQTINQLVSMVMPSMAESRVAAIPFKHRMAFITWWKDQNRPPAGEVKADQPARRQNRKR